MINGATLDAKTGSFTAKTVEVKDILDHDTSQSVGGSVGLSTPGADGLPGGTVQGSYSRTDVEKLELGAVGSGIALHVKDKEHSSDLGTVNRDTTNTQVVIKNESVGVKVYASDTSIKAVADGVQVVGRALGTVLQDITRQLGEEGQVSPEVAQRVSRHRFCRSL